MFKYSSYRQRIQNDWGNVLELTGGTKVPLEICDHKFEVQSVEMVLCLTEEM